VKAKLGTTACLASGIAVPTLTNLSLLKEGLGQIVGTGSERLGRLGASGAALLALRSTAGGARSAARNATSSRQPRGAET
jgi:hypothetical protein